MERIPPLNRQSDPKQHYTHTHTGREMHIHTPPHVQPNPQYCWGEKVFLQCTTVIIQAFIHCCEGSINSMIQQLITKPLIQINCSCNCTPAPAPPPTQPVILQSSSKGESKDFQIL